jgi:DNA-binding transcriptional MerR regulator
MSDEFLSKNFLSIKEFANFVGMTISALRFYDSKEGLASTEKTIIDRCVRLVYRDYLIDPQPDNMPILEDLYNLLRKQQESEAQHIATALEIYVTGSLNVFNHRTNIDVQNPH